MLFGLTEIFPEFGEEGGELTEETLDRLGFGISSSSVGVGGVGVRRSCLNIAVGAFDSASRRIKPCDHVGICNVNRILQLTCRRQTSRKGGL